MQNQKIVRKEEKYLIETPIKDEIIKKLGKILKADEYGDQGFYRVKSLYFDTPDFRDYKDKEENKEERKGIRMRIYNAKGDTIKLELKEKNNEIQKKFSVKIKKEDAFSLLNREYECLKKYDERMYNIMKMEKYEPKLLIFYDRYAFNAVDVNLRVTIDSNLSMSNEKTSFFEEDIEKKQVFSDEKHILEIKRGLETPKEIIELIDSLEKLEKSSSKYKRCCKILIDEMK